MYILIRCTCTSICVLHNILLINLQLFLPPRSVFAKLSVRNFRRVCVSASPYVCSRSFSIISRFASRSKFPDLFCNLNLSKKSVPSAFTLSKRYSRGSVERSLPKNES